MLTIDNRRARRVALRTYGLTRDSDLTSLREIVDLATKICETPMAFLSIIEDETQYFLIRIGFDFVELPIEDTICGQVLDTGRFVAIRDAHDHPGLKVLPPCTAHGVRFYAASPLTTPQGRTFGTLTVLDREPREISDLQRETLEVLSRQVMAHLALRRTIRRAEVMRREVDHRVKNSLQSVSSLTRLQSRRVQSAEARDALEVVSRRIDTIAALNSELYRTGTDRKVALKGFLASVVELIRASGPENVHVSLDMDDVSISASHAGSLAIIVNEFATNSFKHAFPDGRQGRVDILGRQERPGQFRLTCRDNGVGTGPDVPGAGLGLAIIDSAADSVDGEITRTTDGEGYVIEIEFGI